jgi:hypothetical protein
MILNRFGYDVTEAQLVEQATANGWYEPSEGTTLGDAGKLLALYGVATHQESASNIAALFDELQQGHLVIVSVDSGELWEPDSAKEVWEDELVGQISDHMIVVVGVLVSDVSNPLIVVHDPGHPEGAGQKYPMSQFIDAWEDSGKDMIATNEPPPNVESDPIFGSNYNELQGMALDDAFWDNLFSA